MIDQVHRIVQSLSEREYKIVKLEMELSPSEHYLPLLLRLREDDKCDYHELMKSMTTGASNSRAFQQMVVRFRTKLFDIFNEDGFLKADDDRSMQVKQRYQLRKALTASEMMIKKGLDDIAINQLTQIQVRAKKYELYPILREASWLIASLTAETKGFAEFKKSAVEWEEAIDKDQALSDVKVEYYKLFDFNEFSGISKISLDDIRRGILRVNELYYKTESKEIYYYYIRMNNFILERNGKFEEIIEACTALLDHWSRDSAVSSRLRTGIFKLSSADAAMELGDYKRCIEYCNQALLYFGDHMNYRLSLEYRFFAEFYLGKPKDAKQTILEAIRLTPETSKFARAKRGYYRNCLQFLSERKQPTPVSLLSSSILDAHKEDFSSYIRLFFIMNRLDNQDLDSADLGLTNLLAFLQYHKRERNVVSERVKLIAETLSVLREFSYDLSDLTIIGSQMELLSGNDPDFRWKHRSPELVKFHCWVEARARKISYKEFISI
jgi:tetratricopeptide (TPR) repeat protein